jgi:hypothetical protein
MRFLAELGTTAEVENALFPSVIPSLARDLVAGWHRWFSKFVLSFDKNEIPRGARNDGTWLGMTEMKGLR